MNENHIKKLDEAKNRLGAVIRACHGAAKSLDAFFAEVMPDGPEKPDWDALPPERHLLYDCRGSIHDLRRQARRLVFQILHVKRIEMRRFRAKKPVQKKDGAELPWYVVDESHERKGFICLAVREAESRRLVADLADHPDDVPALVERARAEANIIAQSRELFDMLCRVVDVVAEAGAEERFRDVFNDVRELIAKTDGR